MTKSQQEYALRKALYKGAFFIPAIFLRLLLLSVCAALLTACEAKPDFEQVKWVYDGDTLRLKDGRKIRIIGINAPEVAHHGQKAEPFGAEATEQLRQRLKKSDNQVSLKFDDAAKDRYKRVLAHVFFADGTNLSEWMLQKGFASTMIFPPNVRYAKDYAKAQQSAQEKRLGIWSLKSYQLFTSKTLGKSHKGYTRLKSHIKKIQQRKNAIFLELDNKIFIKIEQRYIKYFKAYHPKTLLHHEVVVSGRLKKYKGKRTITVRHPLQVDISKRILR